MLTVFEAQHRIAEGAPLRLQVGTGRMQTIFVQFKCRPGQAYAVADRLVDAVEEISEVHSTSGHYDLMAKFTLSDAQDIGHFVTERLQTAEGVSDTFTTVAFKAFGRG